MKKPAISTITLFVIALIFLFIAVTVKGGGFLDFSWIIRVPAYFLSGLMALIGALKYFLKDNK